MGFEGCGGTQERADRIHCSSSRAGGGQTGCVWGGWEVAGGLARPVGKGEVMEAAATPKGRGGGKSGSMFGERPRGTGRCCGEGGNGSSMPGGGDSDSLIGDRSKCTMFDVPRRSEAAAADASLLAGLLV